MAYIYKRGGTWTYSIEAGRDPATRKRRKITKGGFPRKKDAEAAAQEIEISLHNKTYLANKYTFRQVESMFRDKHARNVKASSQAQYLCQIKPAIAFFADRTIFDIDELLFQDYLLHLRSLGLSYDYERNLVVTAKLIFRFAKAMKIITNDPSEYLFPDKPKIDPLEVIDEVPKYLEKDILLQFTRLTEEDPLDHIFFLTLEHTGMRPGEARALRYPEDIDLHSQHFIITKTDYYDKNGNHIDQSPKTKRSIRRVPFGAILKKALKAWLRYRNEQYILHRNEWHTDSSYLFSRPLAPRGYKNKALIYGYPLTPSTMSDHFKRYLSMIPDAPDVSVYSLRHTYVSLMAAGGVSKDVIKDNVGHVNDKMIDLVYRHVTEQEKKSAVACFDLALKNLEKRKPASTKCQQA